MPEICHGVPVHNLPPLDGKGEQWPFLPLDAQGGIKGGLEGGEVSCIPCVRRFACTRPLRSAKGRFSGSPLMCAGEQWPSLPLDAQGGIKGV